MGPTWGPSGPQVGPMLAPWNLLSGISTSITMKSTHRYRYHNTFKQLLYSKFSKRTTMVPLQTLSPRLSCGKYFGTAGFMKTSSNGNIFRVTGPLCGEFTGPGEFTTQRPVTRSCDVFFDLRPNKRLSKLTWGWWFETPSWSLWRQCKVFGIVKPDQNDRYFTDDIFKCNLKGN